MKLVGKQWVEETWKEIFQESRRKTAKIFFAPVYGAYLAFKEVGQQEDAIRRRDNLAAKNAQPWEHRATVIFKADKELTEEDIRAMLEKSPAVFKGTVVIEEWDEPEPGDPADV